MLATKVKEQLQNQFNNSIDKIDITTVKETVQNGLKKLNELNDRYGIIDDSFNDIKLMVSLLNDYVRGNYKEIPWKTIAALTVTVIYFVSPASKVMKFIPQKQKYVIDLALFLCQKELQTYKTWKESINAEVSVELVAK